jgi:hypothetical protein
MLGLANRRRSACESLASKVQILGPIAYAVEKLTRETDRMDGGDWLSPSSAMPSPTLRAKLRVMGNLDIPSVVFQSTFESARISFARSRRSVSRDDPICNGAGICGPGYSPHQGTRPTVNR